MRGKCPHPFSVCVKRGILKIRFRKEKRHSNNLNSLVNVFSEIEFLPLRFFFNDYQIHKN